MFAAAATTSHNASHGAYVALHALNIAMQYTLRVAL
jgi:hypothetical protein